MEYRKLGRGGLKVSPLCLGAMMFGREADEGSSARMIGMARDAGINFLDTADRYGMGLSEEVCGRAIARERDHWVLATKAANPMGDGPNDRGLTRAYLMRACDASLRRLNTDRIELYYLHKEDHTTPIEETVAVLGDLIRAGKIRYIGLSNWRSWRIAEFVRLCDLQGVERPLALQPCYNIMNRMPEVELLPACRHYGIGVVPYSPLARGILTGKYDPDTAPDAGSRAGRNDRRMMETEWRHDNLVIARKIADHARAKGTTPTAFAVAWLLNNAIVTSPIIGPRTEAQLESYMAALNYRLDAADEAFVNELVVTGHPSTPGYNDPQYPIEGRIALSG